MFAMQCRGETFEKLRISQMMLKDSNASPLLLCIQGISIFYNSPLKRPACATADRGDKGVCKLAVTHPQPLFLEGSLKVAAEGSLI